MKDRFDNRQIACSVTTVRLRDREATLLAQFRSAVIETEELQEGYAFRLPGDGEWIVLMAELIVAERECCPFLAFEVVARRNMGSVIVRVTGSAGKKEFLRPSYARLRRVLSGVLDELLTILEVVLDSCIASVLSVIRDKSKNASSKATKEA